MIATSLVSQRKGHNSSGIILNVSGIQLFTWKWLKLLLSWEFGLLVVLKKYMTVILVQNPCHLYHWI